LDAREGKLNGDHAGFRGDQYADRSIEKSGRKRKKKEVLKPHVRVHQIRRPQVSVARKGKKECEKESRREKIPQDLARKKLQGNSKRICTGGKKGETRKIQRKNSR